MTEHDTLPDALPIAGADPKPWYQSRAIVGSLVVVATQIAAAFGLALDAEQLTLLILDGAALAGGAVALWGRVRAIQPIARLF